MSENFKQMLDTYHAENPDAEARMRTEKRKWNTRIRTMQREREREREEQMETMWMENTIHNEYIELISRVRIAVDVDEEIQMYIQYTDTENAWAKDTYETMMNILYVRIAAGDILDDDTSTNNT